MNELVNNAARDGLAPFKYEGSEDLIENVEGSFYPDRSFPTSTPAATILLSGIQALVFGQRESTWPVQNPLLTEFVEVSRSKGDDPYSKEYMLVWRDVVICYYTHIKRSAAISRDVSFAEVDQALVEIAHAFNQHDLRLQKTQKHFPLTKNASIQQITRVHAGLLEQKQTLKHYWDNKNAQPSDGSTTTSQEGKQD